MITKTNFDATKQFPIEDNIVDLIVTDPPWQFSDKYPGGFEAKKKENNRLGYKTTSKERLIVTFNECYRVLKDDSMMYCWVTNQHLPQLFEIIKETSFKYRQLITWVKNTLGLGYTYRGKTEHCILLSKAPHKKRLKVKNLPNVFNAKNPYHTRKPIAMLSMFVRESSNEGDLVFDPYAGSGSLGEVGLDRKFWLNDIIY